MPKNQFNIFEDDPRKMMDGLRKQYEKGFSDDMDRAAEIVQEEYHKLLRDGTTHGFTGILGEVNVTVKYKRKYKNIPRSIKIYVDDKDGDLPEIVFNVLNSGRKALGAASDYGLKAWPMVYPRSNKFGNNPLTRPHSPEFQTAFSAEDVVFRPVIKKAIAPRNFVKAILERAQKRIEAEGLDYIDVTLSEQD